MHLESVQVDSFNNSPSSNTSSPMFKSASSSPHPLGGRSPIRRNAELHQSSSRSLTTSISNGSVETTDLSQPKHVHSSTGLNILLVDDSIAILKMTGQMLRREKHSVDQAENGAEALEKIDDHLMVTNRCYDVVLIDLQMPVIDGLEATRRLRKIESDAYDAHQLRIVERKSPTPVDKEATSPGGPLSITTTDIRAKMKPLHQIVIGVSAQDDSETALSAFEAGVDGFMCKPFSLQTFLETYENVRQAVAVESDTPTVVSVANLQAMDRAAKESEKDPMYYHK